MFTRGPPLDWVAWQCSLESCWHLALLARFPSSSLFSLIQVPCSPSCAAFLIVVVGVLDDIWDLDWTIKLAAQLGVAALVAWQGVHILSLPIGGITVGSPTMSFLLTIFVIVLVMNAVNFIDGLDGLVAGVSLISNGVFLIYSYLLARETSPSNYFNLASLIAAVLVGACAGFLPFNWHRARLFMGDAGSMLVGLLMAVAGIAVTGQIDPGELGRSQLLPAFLPIMLPFAILLCHWPTSLLRFFAV